MHRLGGLGVVLSALAALGLGACSLLADYEGLSNGNEATAGAGASAGSTASSSSDGGAGGSASSSGGSAGTAGSGGGTGGSGGGNGCPGSAGPEALMIGVPPTSYCIDSTEVRVKDYLAFLDAASIDDGILDDQGAECTWNTSLTPSSGYATWWTDITQDGEEDDPIRLVDWCDAVAYCKWAGKRLCGARTGGPIAKASLATVDAQWFHACTKNGQQLYPYGNQSPEATGEWPHEPSGVCVDGRGGTVMPPNLHQSTDAAASNPGCEGGFDGLFDMSGNVAEWIDSCESGGGAVEDDDCRAQGGSYNFDADACGCSFSQPHMRSETMVTVGFRCCSP